MMVFLIISKDGSQWNKLCAVRQIARAIDSLLNEKISCSVEPFNQSIVKLQIIVKLEIENILFFTRDCKSTSLPLTGKVMYKSLLKSKNS